MIQEKLKNLKLAGIVNTLEERLKYANDNSLSYQQFLEILIEDEENNRRDNSYKKRYNKAKLPAHKTIEEFNFRFQPSINQKLINDASTCQFIKEKRNIIFIGNPGTGKSHLATAIGVKALAKNYKILFTSVNDLLYNLHISKADNSYYKKLNEYLNPDLLILDELGFKSIPNYSADDFFEVISKRYEKGSTIITTNKQFENWQDIFADKTLADAILDRLVHDATIFNIKGESYRSKKVSRIDDNNKSE